MSNKPFEFVGKLSIGKESEKFKPYEEKDYPSGWTKRSIKFNVIAGDNRHLLTVDGGCFKDGHGDVYLYSKGSVDSNNKKIKGEAFTIPFKERFTSKKLAEVAEFKKFIIDLEQPNRRYLLEKALEKINDGTSITNEELTVMGVESQDNIKDELEKSKKKRHEFITEYDYAEFIHKVVTSDKYKNKMFKVLGNIETTYSDKNKKFYTNMIPSRIYLAKDDEPVISEATITLYYNQNSLDDGSLEEKEKYYINGYTFDYDKNRKKNIPCPITIVINKADENDDKSKKTTGIYLKQFIVDDDTWKEIGVKVKLINGAQKTEITEDMLTELQQELLLLGEITLDDIRKELGGEVYGERIQENQFCGLAKGYSKGRKDTVFIDEDFIIKANEDEFEEKDIFDDDEDEI